MKTNPKLTMFKLLLALCCAFATQAVFGQTIYWVGSGVGLSGTEFGNVTNWSSVDSFPGTVNNQPASGDTLQLDGLVAGPLNLVTYVGIVPGNGNIGGGGGSSGGKIELTGHQTSPVTITAGEASANSMGLNALIMDAPGAATLTLGDTSANQAIFVHRPSGGVDTWQNNSTNPMVIMPNAQMQNGGGGTGHIIDFEGTGNFDVTNNLRWNNGAPAESIVWGGNSWTGTNIWAAGGANCLFNSPVGEYEIFGGTVVITTAGLLPFTSGQVGSFNSVVNDGTLVFDGTGQSDTILRTINGTGNLVVNNGTWSMGAANTYSGNNILNGGELVADFAETFGTQGPLGEANQIIFNGGTLGYSSVNNYDYSSEFSTAAGQQYSIDTGSQSVTLATGLGSTGGSLAKTGSGILTLTGSSTYSGSTVINAGKVVFQGGKSGTGSISVADSAVLNVYSGTQVTPSTLTVGTSSGGSLDFNGVSSTSTALIAAGTLSTVGTVTININSGTFTVGDVYPLFTWTTGSAPTVSLGVLNGYTGTLSINGNAVDLTITGTAFSWTGGTSGAWDETTAGNWLRNGASATFSDGIPALLDDSATGTTTLTVGTLVQPSAVTFNNNSKTYSVASSGSNRIGGSSTLTVSGNGNVTLSGGANTFTGVTTLDSGDLTVSNLSNGGVASDIGAAANSAANLVFNGGTLTYGGGGASIDRAFTLGPGGGTIAASGTGPLSLNSAGTIGISGSGSRLLTLSGTDLTDTNVLSAVIADGGGGHTALAMSGAGIWTLTGANTYSGITTINSGILQVGTGTTGALGTGTVADNGSLIFDVSGTVTVNTISGTGSVTNEGTGTVILPGNNSYVGGTTVNAGSTLQVGNGGSTGTLSEDTAVVDNGTLVFNTTGTANLSAAPISGTGNVHVTGTGALLEIIANNTYTGWTLIDAGATMEPFRGNSGELVSSVVTNNGTLYCVCQNIWPTGFGYSNNIVGSGQVVKDNNNQNPGDITIAGTNNTYTNGTVIEGGGFVLGDGVDANSGKIVGSVKFANTASGFLNPRFLRFNFAGNTIFTNPISSAVTDGSQTIYQGTLEQLGPGQVTLAGNDSYPGYTIIDTGTVLQVGNGGTTGSLGSSAIYDGGTLIYDLSANTTLSDNIADDTTNALPYQSVQASLSRGSLEQIGSGTLTLTGTGTTYTGTNFVMSGGLFINGTDAATNTVVSGTATFGGSGTVAGAITSSAGTLLVPGGAVGSIGTLIVTNVYYVSTNAFTNPASLSIGGNVLIAVNKSLAQSNSMFVVSPGTIANTGSGTLTVTNVGATPLAVGDTFNVFNGPVTGGGSLTVTGGGVTWNTSSLASSGTITVASVIAGPKLGLVNNGNGTLTLSWSGDSGAILQAQTNSVTGAWSTYSGGSTSPVTITINPTQNVYYRLVP